MNHQHLTANDILNSCIQIEKIRISRQFSLPRQIVFRLNPHILGQLEQIKQNNNQVRLNPGNLADLRYYALLNSDFSSDTDRQHSFKAISSGHSKPFGESSPGDLTMSMSLYHKGIMPENVPFGVRVGLSPLTFATNYLANDSQEKTIVRSVINLEGKISQQIQQDLWQDSQLLPRVIAVHHWLTVQILTQLPLKPSDHLIQLFKIFWLVLLCVFSIYLWSYLPTPSLFKLLLIGLSFYIFIKYFNKVVKKYFRAWFLHSFINGFLGKSTRKRQLAWKILGILS